jgi:hypothetical protein
MPKTAWLFFALGAIAEFFFESRTYALYFFAMGAFMTYSHHINKRISSLEKRITSFEDKEKLERFTKNIQ